MIFITKGAGSILISIAVKRWTYYFLTHQWFQLEENPDMQARKE